jgi:hypothetical protein
MRRKRQPLNSITGAESFIVTSTTRAATPHLPDCHPRNFDGVIETSVELLNDPPNGTQIHVDLLASGAVPMAPFFEHRLLQRAVIDDGLPAIAVSFYDVPVP